MKALLAKCLFLTVLTHASAAEPKPNLVQEGPLTVRGEGAEKMTWDELSSLIKDQLSLSGKSEVSKPLADDLSFFTRQYYIREGWPNSEVRWELKSNEIFLLIKPGERIRVGKVSWKGELILPEAELEKFLLRPTLEKENANKKNPVWVTADLQKGASLVARRLRAEGYLQAETTLVPATETGPEMRRDLTLEIVPGPRFVFGKVQLLDSPPDLEQIMHDQIENTGGTPFNEASVQEVQRRLKNIARQRGYILAETSADYELGDQGGSVDVTLRVNAGPHPRVARVTTDPALSRGAQRVLKAGFRTTLGQYYPSDNLDLLFRRALDTEMFARLDEEVVMLPGDGEPQSELRLSGEEMKPKALGFEIGFDTFLGPQLGVTYKNTNFRDTGRTLASEVSWSRGGPLGSVRLTDYAIFDSQYAATVRLAVENFSRFEYSRYGSSVNLELARRVSKTFSYSIFAGMAINSVSTENLSRDEIGPDFYTLATAGLNLLLDHRDNPVLPKKGWFLSGRLETTLDVGGSNLSYLRTDLIGAWYQPITKKFRFAAGAGLLSIAGASAEDIPIDLRIFNGGPNTMRSFAERELGPVTPGKTPLGGTAALFANAEFSYEIMPNLEFAVFGDIGSIGRGKISSPFDVASDFRPALGAGLRYHLPFGPVRIDYGRNMDRRAGESSGMLHVTVGFAF